MILFISEVPACGQGLLATVWHRYATQGVHFLVIQAVNYGRTDYCKYQLLPSFLSRDLTGTRADTTRSHYRGTVPRYRLFNSQRTIKSAWSGGRVLTTLPFIPSVVTFRQLCPFSHTETVCTMRHSVCPRSVGTLSTTRILAVVPSCPIQRAGNCSSICYNFQTKRSYQWNFFRDIHEVGDIFSYPRPRGYPRGRYFDYLFINSSNILASSSSLRFSNCSSPSLIRLSPSRIL